jgi:hypothetical protein
MPCCAFAAFLASQVLLALGTIKKFLLRSPEKLDDAPDNSATEWRLGGGSSAPVAPLIRRFGLRPLAIAASIELMLAISTAVAYHRHAQGHNHFELAGLASAPVCGRLR